jgi:hypothetical protein
MIISESTIFLSSQRTAFSAQARQESLTLWRGRQEAQPVGIGQGRQNSPQQLRAAIGGSQDRVNLVHSGEVRRHEVRPEDTQMSEEKEMNANLNMRLLRDLFARLTGRRFTFITPPQGHQQQTDAPAPAGAPAGGPTPQETSAEGFGLAYNYHQSHYEYEKTEFNAGGMITTADGQEIEFSVSLSMSREFSSEQNIQIRAGEALKDPLVLNFSGTAAQLGQRDFHFDIDADGHKDQIAFVAPGSGFLALDKNGDGVINDGRELFGALSGNGFADLAAHDRDGNLWIDENDPIYQDLRIWSRDAEGNDQLIALGMAGVGAIYLGHIATQFSLNDSNNALLGQVRQTGLALMESGLAVTVQQLDLVA